MKSKIITPCPSNNHAAVHAVCRIIVAIYTQEMPRNIKVKDYSPCDVIYGGLLPVDNHPMCILPRLNITPFIKRRLRLSGNNIPTMTHFTEGCMRHYPHGEFIQ